MTESRMGKGNRLVLRKIFVSANRRMLVVRNKKGVSNREFLDIDLKGFMI